VGRPTTRAQLLALVSDQVPDVVVVDSRMPPTHRSERLEAARVIRQESSEPGVLELSAHVGVEYAVQLLASGHRADYLLKRRVTDVEESSRRWSASKVVR
jgi:DNA-binding NarL/FixJ family response regulator